MSAEDKKAAKGKGKKNRKALTPEEKAAKAAKYNSPNENFRTINTTKIGKNVEVTTQACHIRGKGVLVREVSSTGSVSSVFIPGVKIKTKKEWKTLVEDKGPKIKKGKDKGAK